MAEYKRKLVCQNNTFSLKINQKDMSQRNQRYKIGGVFLNLITVIVDTSRHKLPPHNRVSISATLYRNDGTVQRHRWRFLMDNPCQPYSKSSLIPNVCHHNISTRRNHYELNDIVVISEMRKLDDVFADKLCLSYSLIVFFYETWYFCCSIVPYFSQIWIRFCARFSFYYRS